jgi:hypothetical protein
MTDISALVDSGPARRPRPAAPAAVAGIVARAPAHTTDELRVTVGAFDDDARAWSLQLPVAPRVDSTGAYVAPSAGDRCLVSSTTSRRPGCPSTGPPDDDLRPSTSLIPSRSRPPDGTVALADRRAGQPRRHVAPRSPRRQLPDRHPRRAARVRDHPARLPARRPATSTCCAPRSNGGSTPTSRRGARRRRNLRAAPSASPPGA